MRTLVLASSLALLLAGCPEKGPPPQEDVPPAAAKSTDSAATTPSASPADVSAATAAYDAYKQRLNDLRGLLLPYRDGSKKAAPCKKRTDAEPALLLDNDHSFATLRQNHRPHWGRVAAQLEILNYTAFLESDKKEMRDWPFDPKTALAALQKINATKATIFIDVEEKRPEVDGDLYKPGAAKGVAYVVDAKKTVCTVPIDYTQSGKVKFESLVFENDPEFSAIDKRASASLAVEYAYDHAIARQVLDALAPLGWTNVVGPRAPKT